MHSLLYKPVSDIREDGPAYDEDENPDDAMLLLPIPPPLAPPPPKIEGPPHEPSADDVGAGDPQLNAAATPEPAIC